MQFLSNESESQQADALLTPFLSVSAHYQFQQSVPQDLRGNTDGAVVALHAFF